MPASSLPPRIEVGGISASDLLNDVPHRVCSPSLSPHAPVVVLVRLWVRFVHEGGKGGRVIRRRGAGALLMPLHATRVECWGLGLSLHFFVYLVALCAA
eukprot:scaffold10155_cov117-Isochrysis_galbana.AAC.1